MKYLTLPIIVLFMTLLTPVSQAAQVVESYAGTGDPGFSGDNGLATSANLNTPTEIGRDSSDSIIFLDSLNTRIRKIDVTTGLISTVSTTSTSVKDFLPKIQGYSCSIVGGSPSFEPQRIELVSSIGAKTYPFTVNDFSIISISYPLCNSAGIFSFSYDRQRDVGLDIRDSSGTLIGNVYGDKYSGVTVPPRPLLMDNDQVVYFQAGHFFVPTDPIQIKRFDLASKATTVLATITPDQLVGKISADIRGLTFGGDGSLYVSDVANHRILRIRDVIDLPSALTIYGKKDTPLLYNLNLPPNINPVRYAISGAPSWINVDASTGTVSATLPVVGTYVFTMTATNLGGTVSSQVTLTIVNPDPVVDFTIRFYRKCLSREPDAGGLNYWTTALKTKQMTGSDVARSFILSPEFQNRDQTSDDFVETLYGAFFDRPSDIDGKLGWINLLDAGGTREDVVYGFILASEFNALCNQFGIQQIDAAGLRVYRIRQFVRRFYQKVLGREPDVNGIATWVSGLKDGSLTGSDVAERFIISAEFQNKTTTNTEYIDILYQSFFARTADSAGQATWLAQLFNGISRGAVLKSFINSQEFTNLCTEYGIIPRTNGG